MFIAIDLVGMDEESTADVALMGVLHDFTLKRAPMLGRVIERLSFLAADVTVGACSCSSNVFDALHDTTVAALFGCNPSL
jgi:hypothetical protein